MNTSTVTSTAPAAVQCHVIDATRVDLRVNGVTYLGAALHGAGGVLRGYDSARVATFLRRRAREPHPVLIYTTHTPAQSVSIEAEPACIEVLRVWP